MKHLVLGTAGHIDHGKSALVRALTGIEPDRWEEEKRRGITIDLGFAHLILGAPPHALRAAFIDVPGHERFVRNMLAGAGGIDAVLLVIAADESVMPQTREHFDICRLLGIRHGLIVITKSDLVSPDLTDLVRLEAEDFVRGSFLDGAPILPVSAKTGAGLDDLKSALLALASRIEGKSSARPLRLPIDRSFTLKGFGTVVTGTLISGRLRADDEVEVHPLGRTLRVRGLQVHGDAAPEATAGQRTAVNLAAVEATDLARGMTLAPPGLLRSTQRIDAEIELLPSARPLKHNAPLHFHAWTSETPAKVKLLETNLLQPGHKTWARLLLDQPVLLLPGDRFILRSFAPPITIAGGAVIDIDPPLRQRRAALAQRTAALATANIPERIAQLVRESPHGLSPAELIARTGLRRDELSTQGPPPDWFVDPHWIAARRTDIEAALAAFHKRNPLLPGMPLEELRSRTLADAPPFLLDHIARDWPALVITAETARLASHAIAFQDDEAAALDKIESAFASGGLAVPATDEVLAQSGVDPAKAKTLLQLLLRQRRLIKVSPELVYHAQAIDALRQLLAARKGTRFSVTEFKDWTGVSRKYAIPLLEFLDRERLTRRDGDSRLIL
ncbi:MAG: selenocysteine-specific translation elongation factor [Bryobacterales bacterium]|nr:selenocysteine-specific translation elongation factor [Bryobacterales bacterium]